MNSGSKYQHNDAQTPRTSFRLYLILGLFFLLVFSGTTYAAYEGYKFGVVDAPLVDAAMEIKLETTISYLWFKKIFSGDRDVEIDVAWEHLDNAHWYAHAMLEGGENSEGTFMPLKDPEMRKEVSEVHEKIGYLRNLTQARLEIREGDGSGTEIDLKYHAAFEDLLAQTDRVETLIQKQIRGEIFAFRNTMMGLFVAPLLLVILVGESFNRFGGRRAQYFEAVQGAQEEFEVQIKELTDELIEANRKLRNELTERKHAEGELVQLTAHLEERVKERTHELALASEELIRKEKLATLGQLSGSIAHEIRNPLGVIGNSVYYLKMKLGGADGKVKRHLDILQGEVLRTNAIISDLLNFSRGVPPALAKGDVSGIIKDALKDADLPENVKVKTSFGFDLYEAIFDPNQMRQVFLNIISNAIQAMPEGGTLKIKTRAKNGFIEAKVGDSGGGIPEENLEKIFEPLFTTKARGTGLGLAIVKGIIERHNGSIEVESSAYGGTTFTVMLPVTDAGAS